MTNKELLRMLKRWRDGGLFGRAQAGCAREEGWPGERGLRTQEDGHGEKPKKAVPL